MHWTLPLDDLIANTALMLSPPSCLPASLQALLLIGTRPSVQVGPCADLAPLSVKAADGFIVQPAVLQAAALECSGSSSGVPAAASSVCLPAAATVASAAAWSAGGAAATLVASGSSSLAVALQGVQYCTPQQLEPSLAAAPRALDVVDTVYQLEWQAADSLAASALAAVAQPQTALAAAPVGTRGGRPLAALALSQAASVAAAGAVQMLHSHVRAPIKALTLHAADSVPAQPQMVATQPAVGVAAIAGVLKNLPYEMPFISAQVLDTESASSNAGAFSGRAFALSAAALPASLQSDLYGVAARGGALHRPLLTYAAAPDSNGQPAAPAAVGTSGTYVITGGLGGLGLMTASWMASSGTHALVLLSRSGVASASDSATITRASALISIAKCDVSISEDARLLAATARSQTHRFSGIVHTAGLQVR